MQSPCTCVADPFTKSRENPILPNRQKRHGYKESDYPYKLVPELDWASI